MCNAGWANNPGFPFAKGAGQGNASAPPVEAPPTGTGPGFDSIIGVNAPGKPRFIIGTKPAEADALSTLELVNKPTELAFDNVWVVPRGGEYFFSPSISALQETFAQAA